MKKQLAVPPVWLCWFTSLGGLAAYCWAHGDPITAAVASLVVVTGLAGYWLGGAAIVASLVAIATSAVYASKVVETLGPTVGKIFGTIGILNSILAACIGCTLIGFLVMVAYEIVWNRLLGKRGHLQPFDRLIGLSFGALQGVVVSFMILGGILVAEPYAQFARYTVVTSVRGYVGKCTADSVVKVGHASRRTPLEPYP